LAAWPDIIRIEVKTSSQETVPLPVRELEALAAKTDSEAGIVAALFWSADWNVEGNWLLADADDTFRRSTARVTAVSRTQMQQAHRGQPWLNDLKAHVENLWPRFLHAFLDDALLGHEALCRVLQECHEQGQVAARLPRERVLETDHRDALQRIIDQFGESQAGHIFQDLFAYLVGHAGYREVLLNAVGVPDVTVSGFRRAAADAGEVDFGRLRAEDARKLLHYSEQAGDAELAALIRGLLARD